MSDQQDDTQHYALLLLAGIVALVIAGVMALAASKGFGASPKPGAASRAAATLIAGEAEGRIFFETGSAALPVDASDVLVRMADTARMEASKVVLISGFHDASGDAAANAKLAKQRALAVRHALEANGVAPDRLVLDKPTLIDGGPDPRAARRVELRLR